MLIHRNDARGKRCGKGFVAQALLCSKPITKMVAGLLKKSGKQLRPRVRAITSSSTPITQQLRTGNQPGNVTDRLQRKSQELIKEWSDIDPSLKVMETTVNKKHRYVLTKLQDELFVGVAESPRGTNIKFEMTPGGEINTSEVNFEIEGSYERARKRSAVETLSILSQVERMLQKSIESLPPRHRIKAFVATNDGLGASRKKLYERYGFYEADWGVGHSILLEAQVRELKSRNRRNDAFSVFELTPKLLQSL